MLSHQDLKPGPGLEGDAEDRALREGVGRHQHPVSGAQTSRRSESDIRVDFWNPNRVISASNNISGGGQQGQYWSRTAG